MLKKLFNFDADKPAPKQAATTQNSVEKNEKNPWDAGQKLVEKPTKSESDIKECRLQKPVVKSEASKVSFEMSDKKPVSRAKPQRSNAKSAAPRGKAEKAKICPREPMPHIPKGKLRFIPLGGMNTVTGNCFIYETDQDIVVIDCGFQFPDESMQGINYVIPDIKYLKENIKKIRGIIITHGHYDHIGAIPHVMKELKVPIYASGFCKGVIEARQEEYDFKLDVRQYDNTSRIKLGSTFCAEFFRVSHTIPDSHGIILHTPAGKIMHTGDWKIDHSPVGEKPIDIHAIAKFSADDGILALFADALGVTEPGYQISEQEVKNELEKIFLKAKGRILVGTYSSNVSRIISLIELAEKHGRFVVLDGRSMKQFTEVAVRSGFLKIKNTGIFKSIDEISMIDDKKLLILATGSQGEPRAVFTRIAAKAHKHIQLKQTDSIVFSSSIQNRDTVAKLKDNLYKSGCKIYDYHSMTVHSGGHARAEEKKMLLQLVKPKNFIPVSANYFMRVEFGRMAIAGGMKKENIFLPEDGAIIEFSPDGTAKKLKDKLELDFIAVDGKGVGDVGNAVLRERETLGKNGVVVPVIKITRGKHEIVGRVELATRGFVFVKSSREFVKLAEDKAKAIAEKWAKKAKDDKNCDQSVLRDDLRHQLTRFFKDKIDREPLVLPVVITV